MNDDLKKLLSLQEIDSRIDRVSAEMEEIPREKRIHERELQSQRSDYENEKKKIEEIRERNRKSSGEKENTVKELADFKNKLLEMKTNEAYRTMLVQIKYAENKISELDIKLLELMYEEESSEENLKETKKVWERNEERFLKRQNILDGQMEVLEENIRELRNEREEIKSNINIRLLDKYEQLRSADKGNVIVGLNKGACGGCLTNLPPQTAVEINQGSAFTCPICGRFVIWMDDSSFAGSG
jgi:predicted  nucleic acid-binding Zn-ribbon protein